MEICRACMKDTELFRLNETYLESYNLLTNLSVRIGDSLPQFICKTCWGTVEAFTKFRNECINTESSLYSTVNEQVFKPESDVTPWDEDLKEVGVGIKQEVDDGDEDILFEDGNDSDTYLEIKTEEEDLLWSSNRRPKRECRKRKASPPAVAVKKGKQTKKSTKKIEVEQVTGKIVRQKVEINLTPLNNTEHVEILSCGLCKSKCEDRESLYKHLEMHKHDTECSICQARFKTWQHLMSHRLNHIDKNQWRCHQCWHKIPNEPYLEYHYYKKHGDMKEFSGLQCRDCSKLFVNPGKLQKHLRGVHSSKKFVCDYCSKVVNMKQNMIVHLRSHQLEKQFSCKRCGLSFKSPTGLADHKMRKHSTTTVQCQPCSRLFPNQSRLDRHKCSIVPTICPFCGKTCNTYRLYKSHVRIHKDKRHACNRCPATFKSKNALCAHNDRHDGYRRHRCHWLGCTLAFYTDGGLSKHFRVHTGEKPYVCTVCNKGFTGNNNLKVHMRVHGFELVKKRDTDTSAKDFYFDK